MNKTQKTRNALQVMLGLIGMVKPMLGVMCIAIIMGCIGNLMATFITVLGGVGIGIILGMDTNIELGVVFGLIAAFAVLRGILRYTEQASNHYIAFKLLARIRHQVFAALRKLAPAKLDGSQKGNLISIITSDIELLEVFYAHTISPIAIAVLTSIFMCIFMGYFQPLFAVAAAIAYLFVGVIIPVINSRMGQEYGREYRKLYGNLNTTVLDNLYGLDEILQYAQQKPRMEKMNQYTVELEKKNKKLKSSEALQRIITDCVILTAGIVVLLIGGFLCENGQISMAQVIICTIAMMSSFGPTAALSSLSNNLNQTLASGNRVLNLLEEKPIVEEISKGKEVPQGQIEVKDVSFSYTEDNTKADSKAILEKFSILFEENKIHGILGKSGCGKSTLLKLLMRFYETDKGSILYNGVNVNEIQTDSLRNYISYVTQDTFLFSDTIENNIKVAKENATRSEVIEAAKKASIHEFITSLPNGYDTVLSELGDSVSGGERQRIGLARAFLHDSKVILLDEPTSNIDSLNEGIILQSLEREKEDKTIILVSHRKSTMGIADKIVSVKNA